MSENMKAITRINGQSRISYGKIVEQRYLFGIEKPVEKKEDKSHWRTCSCCGKLFEPEIRHDGTYGEPKKCEECCSAQRSEASRKLMQKKRAEQNRDKKERKERKVYKRECAQCGAMVETKQPPRGNIPIFCPECRKNRNRDAARERYRKRKKLCTE